MLREQPDSEVEAVADVVVEGLRAAAEASRRFYGELLGLLQEETVAADGAAAENELRFLGQRHRLVLRLTDQPDIDATKRAVLICVRSLRDVGEKLDESGADYDVSRSLGLADRRIWLRDPSGNLVELRQETLL